MACHLAERWAGMWKSHCDPGTGWRANGFNLHRFASTRALPITLNLRAALNNTHRTPGQRTAIVHRLAMRPNQRNHQVQHALWQLILLHRDKQVLQLIHRAFVDGVQDLDRPSGNH